MSGASNGLFMAENAPIAHRNDGRIRNMAGKREATVEDLYRVKGKAEIVCGELRPMTPTGGLHGYAAVAIAFSLHEYGRRTKRGYALADNVGFIVNLPNRRSFSPDAAFWTGGPLTTKFIEGAPLFAAEVRSEDDEGPAAERAMAEKRSDYFAVGTLVLWDVDVLKEQVVRVYRASDPTMPTMYRRGEVAEAEPALPGWSMPVEDLFPEDRT
jgi:Uma2 family endonuclease